MKNKKFVSGLDHINITVDNFDETIDWYRRVFNFKLVEKGIKDEKPWGILKSGKALLCMYEQIGLNGHDPELLRIKGFHSMSHFGLRINDKQKWLSIIKDEKLMKSYQNKSRRRLLDKFTWDKISKEYENELI